MFFQALGVILVLGSILFLAYVTTKYIGNKTKKASKGNLMNVVESISLGMDKQLHLIKVGEQFVLISTAGKSVQFMTEIKLDHFENEQEDSSKNTLFDFKGMFEKYIQAYKDKKSGKSGDRDGAGAKFEVTEGEVFKSNLNRLKSITERLNKKGKIDGDENTNEK